MRLLLLLALLISFLGARAEGPENPDTVHVRLVRKTPRISMQDVKVKVKQVEQVFTSTPTGYVALTGLEPGKYLLVVEGDGFRMAEKQIEKKINSKITVVRDSSLRPRYLPESYANQSARYELGSYLKINFQKEIMKNVILNSRADFFASHLSSFGSIDVNWENAIALKVNKYLTANILTHLIYDEDILFNVVDESGQLTGEKGPRTQFREALNVGLVTTF